MTDQPHHESASAAVPVAIPESHDAIRAAMARGMRIRSAYWHYWTRRLLDLILGRRRPLPPYADPATIIPAEAIDDLLAMNDNALTALGVRRDDVMAFRDGRIKHLKRWR